MTINKDSERKHLQEQIFQLREAVATIENQADGSTAIQPEEIWNLMKSNFDKNEAVHPRLQQIFVGHVDIEEVKISLKRLENDLRDLDLEEPEEMYDPFEHDIDEEKNQSSEWGNHTVEDDEDAEQDANDNPALNRDAEQRPLSAYKNSVEK